LKTSQVQLVAFDECPIEQNTFTRKSRDGKEEIASHEADRFAFRLLTSFDRLFSRDSLHRSASSNDQSGFAHPPISSMMNYTSFTEKSNKSIPSGLSPNRSVSAMDAIKQL